MVWFAFTRCTFTRIAYVCHIKECFGGFNDSSLPHPGTSVCAVPHSVRRATYESREQPLTDGSSKVLYCHRVSHTHAQKKHSLVKQWQERAAGLQEMSHRRTSWSRTHQPGAWEGGRGRSFLFWPPSGKWLRVPTWDQGPRHLMGTCFVHVLFLKSWAICWFKFGGIPQWAGGEWRTRAQKKALLWDKNS